MLQTNLNDALLDASVLDIVRTERSKALSTREWMFRLAGYGYGVKKVGDDHVLTKLPKGTELGILPANLA